MAEHTLGRRIVERRNEVKIFGKMYKLKANVVTLNAFSAHADYNEIKKWIKNYDLNKLKKIFLVHGEDDALTHLKKELLSIGVKGVEIVKCGQDYALEE
jgi:metallo-beta-lactamase family protein